MIDIVIPVYRQNAKFYKLIERLADQTIKPEKLILMYTISGIDERETDAFEQKVKTILRAVGADDIDVEVYAVRKEEFSPAKTREQGYLHCRNPYVLFMNEDAYPANSKMIENLVEKLESDPKVVLAYARQKTDDKAIDYVRYNQDYFFPKEVVYKTREDYESMGVMAVYCSNVCCMYKRDALEYIGGFGDVKKSEELIFARKAMDAGFTICYAGDAEVVYYRKLTLKGQFMKSYRLAAARQKNKELYDGLSSKGEGGKLLKKVLLKLIVRGKIFQAIYYVGWTLARGLGFRIGQMMVRKKRK